MPTGALKRIHFCCCCCHYCFKLKVYIGPKYPSTHIFFLLTLSWVLALEYSEQGCLTRQGRRQGDAAKVRLNRQSLGNEFRKQSLGREHQECCPSVPLWGRTLSCSGSAGLLCRFEVPVAASSRGCFSHFQPQALKWTEKPFSCLWLQWIRAEERGQGAHQTPPALSITSPFQVNSICRCNSALETEHSRGSQGGRGCLGWAKCVCHQKDHVGFLTSEPEISMSRWRTKKENLQVWHRHGVDRKALKIMLG